MKSVQQLIIEALNKHGGIAHLKEIYSYVEDHLTEVGVYTEDYRHTVRGILTKLKKDGIVQPLENAKATYRIVKQGQH